MRDSISNIQVKRAISSISGAGDTTAQVSQIIDTLGFDSLAFLINIGVAADADATFAVLVEHDDAAGFGTAVAVPDDMLVSQTSGTAPEAAAGFQFDDDNEVRKIGYVGDKRYVRLTITPAANTGAWPIGVLAVLGRADQKPVIQAAA